MSVGAVLYGHSRGYRVPAGICASASFMFAVLAIDPGRTSWLPAAAAILCGILFGAAWSRATKTVAVLKIEHDGLVVCDPALPLGLIEWDNISEIRVYATQARPVVAIGLTDRNVVRRAGPCLLRIALKPIWALRRYPVALQLADIDDQIAALRSVALQRGIPFVSELV